MATNRRRNWDRTTWLRMCRSLTLAGYAIGIVVLLAGCARLDTPFSTRADEREIVRERLLLWHTWTGDEAQVLNEKLDRYMELVPDVRIIALSIPEARIVQKFAEQNARGLGPDLVLVDAGTLYDLADAGLVRDIGSPDLDLSRFLEKPLRMVKHGDQVYGLPFAAHTHVLFYHRSRVDDGPADVWEWLARAQNGEMFALNTGFIENYWGIGAYHGRTVDDEKNEILIRLGGFKNWLQALQVMRTVPNFIFDKDADALRSAFLTGEADAYFGSSSELPELRRQLGDDAVGVAVLPMGPNGGIPRPLLFVSALAFGTGSTPTEYARARGLADFLTGYEEQMSLALADSGRVPVNNQVRITASMPERTITVAHQIGSAIEIAFASQSWWRQVQAGSISLIADHHAVVEGVMEPDAFLRKTALSLQNAFGFTEKQIDPASFCPEHPAAVDVWHAMTERELAAMTEIAADFVATCPGTAVTYRYVPYAEIFAEFVTAVDEGEGPVLLYASSRWLPQLAARGAIQDISEQIAPEDLQHLHARALRMMVYDQRLYGVPESIAVLALYYNPAKVGDAPGDLDLLLQRVDAENRLALPVSFFWGFWGMRPFGAFDWNSETGSVDDAQGLVDWLTWLQAADKRPGVDLFFDWTKAEDLFAAGEAAYLVSGPWSLPRMEDALGEAGFRVMPLPGGTMGPGSPMLRIRGSMINANANQAETETALAFAQFLTLQESQQRLLDGQGHVSANVTVNLDEFPNLKSFRDQARVAAMVQETVAFRRMEERGDDLYRAVLLDDADPAAAVAEFVEAVNAAHQAESGRDIPSTDSSGADVEEPIERAEP